MQKPAPVSELHQQQLLTEIYQRWSPRAFSEKDLSSEEIDLLFEAARWAPSCANEQPWEFLVYSRTDSEREKMEGYLSGGNYWAKSASHLVVACARTRFKESGKPNRHAYYDTGAAVLSLTLQAQHMGIHVHQMAGFDHEALEQDLKFDEHTNAVAMIAIGVASENIEKLSEKHQQIEKGGRQRKDKDQFMHLNATSLD